MSGGGAETSMAKAVGPGLSMTHACLDAMLLKQCRLKYSNCFELVRWLCLQVCL